MRRSTSPLLHRLGFLVGLFLTGAFALGQVTTPGFLNQARSEAPGTLLSHPITNGSEPIGRTTSINYLNGWIIVGGEIPGSREGSDLLLRVYDISNPTAPIRRYPSDFKLTYPNNRWYEGNFGWGAHGTAQQGVHLLPNGLRVASFGAPVELGGTNGIPAGNQMRVGDNRSGQAGPWESTILWYDKPDIPFTIRQPYLNSGGYREFRTLATFDHVGPYGGGDWHPMFFGDLLIYARSGTAARDGVVIYRLQYNNWDNPSTRSVTPVYVGSLPGGFQAYWPTLFSDGTKLFVIGTNTNIILAADISRAADPTGDGTISLAASLTVTGQANATYPVYEDNFGFIQKRKIDMARLVAGDPNPTVLTLNESTPPVPAGTPATPSGVDTSQMSLVLGNLWLTGGYPRSPGTSNYLAQGMSVWVHQQTPDTTRPRVSFHIPQAGRVNYPRQAPLSFLLPAHPRRGGPRNGTDFTVRSVLANNTLGTALPGFLIHDFSGVLTFTPDASLAADTVYQVDFLASDAGTPSNLNDDIGFQDAAGNLIEPYAFRFSTGGLTATTPPAITAFTSTTYQPAPGAPMTVSATATGAGPLSYRFNFAGTWTTWSSTPSASHTYTATGRPQVLVQVRDAAGQIVSQSLRLLVIAAPTGPRPTQSAPLAIGNDPAGHRLWVVNPDANTVSVLNSLTGAKLAEYPVGTNPRSIARDAQGRYWVANHGSDSLTILNPDGSVATTRTLAFGAAPFGVAPSPDGTAMFVTLYGTGKLQRYTTASLTDAPVTTTSTVSTARAIAVSGDGTRVFVTRFISNELDAEVAEFAGTSATLSLTRTIRLSSANPIDGGDRASGVPNYLASIAISPDGTHAAIASKQDNIQRGRLFGVGDLTHETTARSVISILNLSTNSEIRHARRDIDNADSPAALTYTPLGDTILVALQGNNEVVGVDALALAPITGIPSVSGSTETVPATIAFELGSGLAPQGVLIDPDSNRLFVQNFMGRSVSVRDAEPLLQRNLTSLPLLATTSTVANEPLSSTVLLGKQIFYNASDPRMSADSYISCATCHVDGGHDGRVWDFTGRGEGLRRTTDLRGRSGLGHGNLHWSANFDEIQDFEHDIRGPFGGTGFLPLPPQQFATQHPSPATGKAGLSPELDALAAYVASLTPTTVPRSPTRNADGTRTSAAISGRTVFNAQGCATCHAGDTLTTSTQGSITTRPLSDLGTLSALSGLRLDQPLTGIDIPTLHGLHAARTYLHHGQASTLADVFTYVGGALRLASDATFLTTVVPGAVAVTIDKPEEGGGGTLRGAFGGTTVAITAESGAATPPGVRFSGIDGGLNGGPARIAVRYVRLSTATAANTKATLRINGASQSIDLLVQTPNNSSQISGWRWLVVDANLQAGTGNTIEVLRNGVDFHLNALLVANADDLLAADPHHRYNALGSTDRNNLLAYLRQLDGRDDAGVPLAAPAQPSPLAPTIVSAPPRTTRVVGQSLSLTVAVGGTGPFTYVWRRDTSVVGVNSPVLEIPAVQLADAGTYTVTVSNAQGSVVTSPAVITINPTLAVATAELPRATVGRAYAVDLAASGGQGARTWDLAAGVLPVGLSLSTSGRLTGSPVAPARAALTVRVTDSYGSANRVLALDVRPIGGFSTDTDLVLHYTFDEGTGTRIWDASPQGNNHVTDVPGATWSSGGRFGGAYGSTNLASALVPFFPANQGDLNFDPLANACTLSVWVRTTTSTGNRTLLSKDGDATQSWRTQFRLWTTTEPGSSEGVSGHTWSGGQAANLADGQWHLVTLVNLRDGATWRARLYVDGIRRAQWATGSGGRVTPLLRVGDTSHGGNEWRGQLDDLRIYKRALTDAEVSGLYAPPAVQSYDTWIAGLATPPSSEHRGVDADPDGDGLANLLEYALGGDPLSALSAPHPQLQHANGLLRLSYRRARTDLTYVVETATHLATGEWTTAGVTQDTTTPVGQTATATTPFDAATVHRFLRLRVNEP